MGAQQFQNIVLVWLGVIVIIIPVMVGVVVLMIQQLQRIIDVWNTLKWHERAINTNTEKVATIEKALNGTLSKPHADNSITYVNPPVGNSGDSHS